MWEEITRKMIYESMFHSLPIHQEERKLSIRFSKKVKKWLYINHFNFVHVTGQN